MGESERYLDLRLKKIRLGDDNNALMALVAINVMIFISLGLIKVIYLMSQSSDSAFQYEILRWFTLPAKLSMLSTAPWTFFTSMFVNTGVIFTVVNMLWLYAFGSILQSFAGNDKIIPVYIYGGIAGAIIFIMVNYALPPLRDRIEFATLFGSNASIMAVAIATTTIAPGHRIFRMLNGGIPLWVLTICFVIIDVAGAAETGRQIAHLGGGLCGFLFMTAYKKGNDWGAWMNDIYSWFMNLFNPERPKTSSQKLKNKIFYNTGNRKPFSKNPVVTQQRIDQILDKINQKGMSYLTEEEREILNKAGEADF